MSYLSDAKPLSLNDFRKMKAAGEKLAMITAYDASFAQLLEAQGAEMLLVGDSLGNVVQGRDSTVAVTMRDMVYHVECVARGARRAMVIGDLPFGSYQESREQALRNACQLMAAGARMVKLEGGAFMAETVAFMVERGVPVCAHIGLTPQSVHQLGGYRVQGRTDEGARQLKADALALEQAGASMAVLEMVPASLAGEVTAAAKTMATIGIGAGPLCDGQVLVLHDMLGVYPGKKARFQKDFLAENGTIPAAIAAYVKAVKSGQFPAAEHSY